MNCFRLGYNVNRWTPTLGFDPIHCRSSSEFPFSRSPSATMSTNGILSFLIYLSLRSQLGGPSHFTWRLRLEALALSAALHLRGWYKFVCRSVTGCGAIERLCRTALGDSGLWINEKGIEIRGSEMRKLVWRIGTVLCIMR